MADLTININQSKTNRGATSVTVELNPSRFERLAADLGLFNPEFLSSLKKAEQDIITKKTRKITSLNQLI
jgi:hypothetical protein